MSFNQDFEIYGDTAAFYNKELFSVTIGNFDGVHAGHIFLLNKLDKASSKTKKIVITFDPHPATYFCPQNPKPLLTSLPEKIALLLSSHIDVVLVQKFTKEFSLFTADDFCHWLKNILNIDYVLLGYDFCYGFERKGNINHMKSFVKNESWQAEQAPAFRFSDNKIVSSSLVREALIQGNAELAETLLTRPYFLSGEVVQGDQRGRLIGFPTANIMLSDLLVIPKNGVYACFVEIDGSGHLLPSVMNCGVRPTIAHGLKLQIEAHILNFSEDIYHRKVKFHIKKFIRGEMKFNGIAELKSQIEKDVQTAVNYFAVVHSLPPC